MIDTKNVRKKLKKEFNTKIELEVPIIRKIVINMGIGKMRENKNYIEESVEDLRKITGQTPSKRKARLSISNFKLRKGQLTGLMVTLRGQKMWDFYERLTIIAFPRVRDFRGITKKAFDGAGNYNVGLKEHIVFPEIDANKTGYTKPLQITINTSADDDIVGYKLLKALGMPFKD